MVFGHPETFCVLQIDVCHMCVVLSEIQQLCHPKMQSSHNPKSQSFRRFLAQEWWTQKAPEADWNCLDAGDSKELI